MKKNLFTLLIIISISFSTYQKKNKKQVDIFNNLKYPIYINTQTTKYRGEIPKMKKTGAFTISGWLKPEKFNENYINIFRVYNEIKKKDNNNLEYNTLYPMCPYSFVFLQKYPEYQKYYNVQNNPNCFLNKKQNDLGQNDNFDKFVDQIDTICSVDIVKENNSLNLKFDFPVKIDENENKVIFNQGKLDGFKIQPGFWIFFAISFNYPENKGIYFVKIYNDDKIEQFINKEFRVDIPDFYLHKKYNFYYSENSKIQTEKNLGLLYDVNISYDFFNNLELFSLFNMNEKNLKINNKIIEFKFEETRTNRQIINSLGSINKQYEIEGYFRVENRGVDFHEGSFVKLNTILQNLPDTLIKSPTFYLSFKITNLENKIFLISSSGEKGIINVFVKPKENGFVLGMEYIGKLIFSFETKKIFELNQDLDFAFTLSFSDKRLEFYIWFGDKNYEKSKPFYNLETNLSKLDYFLLSKENKIFNILVYRFLVLENPLPFIMQNQNSLDKFELECKTFLIPNLNDKNICLNCENSVLDSDDQNCSDFCKIGEKNINGVCQKCIKNTCEEIKKPVLLIQDIDQKNFKINLSQKLFKNNLKTLKKDLEINFSPPLNTTYYNYTLTDTKENENELILKLETKKSIFNSTLIIKLKEYKLGEINTINREKIEKLETSIKMTNLRHLGNYSKTYLNVLAYIIISIFWFLILIGIILFFLHLKHNFNDFAFKKLSYVFVNIQIVSLLVFCGVQLPTNFTHFLNTINHYTLRYFSFHNLFVNKIQDSDFNKKFINFENNNISPLIIDNLGVLNILHIIIIFTYIISKILIIVNKCKPFSSKVRENIFRIKDNFEFNIMITSFIFFSVPIFSFLVLDLKELNYKSPLSTISIVVSITYIIIFILGVIIFSIVFFMNSGFTGYSLLKNKLDYLFLGYKSTKNSNLYEIIEIILNCFIGLVLTGLYNKSVAQVTFLLCLNLLKILSISMIKPHLENWNKINDYINKILWIAIFLLISCISMFDSNSISKIEQLGFVMMVIICFMIFFEFLSSFFLVVKYLSNLKKNEQVNYNFQKLGNFNNNSLVDNNQGKQSFQSIQSKDFLQKKNYKNDFKKEYENLEEEKNDSYFDEKEEDNKNKSIRNNIKKRKFKEDLNELKSGKGSHHDSYISRSENSIIIHDKKDF